jgi:hypothetical protein
MRRAVICVIGQIALESKNLKSEMDRACDTHENISRACKIMVVNPEGLFEKTWAWMA